MIDGLGGEEVIQVSGVGLTTQNPYFQGTVIGGIALSGPSVLCGNATVTGSAIVGGKLASSAGAGSPTTWGKNSQAGAFLTDAGSQLWVVFGTAFSAAPTVIAGAGVGTTDGVMLGEVKAGSFQALSNTASKSGTWVAIG